MKLSCFITTAVLVGATPAMAAPALPSHQAQTGAVRAQTLSAQTVTDRVPWERGAPGGECRLRLDIRPDGRVTNVRVDACTDDSLRQAARRAAYALRYPARERSAPMVTDHALTLRFDIQES